jgi:MFS family permease
LLTKNPEWTLTAIICIQNFAVSMGSSVFTPGTGVIAAEFHKSQVVTTLGLSFYVLGFALGPIFFAPLSEIYGRRIVQVPCWCAFMAFQLGCALAGNIETLLISRFLVGMFGSPSLTVAGGVVGDFWHRTRPLLPRRPS